MKRKVLIATIFAGLAAGAMTATAATAMRLTLSDGTTPCYILSERPKVTFAGADLTVAVADASTSYPRSSVTEIDFTDVEPSAIESIGVNAPQLGYLDGTVTAPGALITVFDVSGTLRLQGRDTLSLDALPAGVCIVSADGLTLKILK